MGGLRSNDSVTTLLSMPTNPAAKRFRKKTVTPIVDAVQWTGDNVDALSDFADGRFSVAPDGSAVVWVEKSNMWASVPQGTWLIAETDGTGVYPCAEDVFDATYEAAQ